MACAFCNWFVVVVLLIADSTWCYPQPQLGLFGSLLGNNQQQGRALRPGPGQTNNLGLLNLFQGNRPNKEADPETKQNLLEQKEKLEDLLQRLKEKQKEVNGNRTTTDRNDTNRPTTKPIEVTTTTERHLEGKRVWKKIAKKKFFMQVQPVVPENEILLNKTDTVYYLEL